MEGKLIPDCRFKYGPLVLYDDMKKLPMIVTLQLEEEQQAFFDAQRKAYFPAHRNYLDAHITLFYHLPMGEAGIPPVLQAAAQRSVMPLRVQALHNMGTGVAYGLVSEELQALHENLQQALDPWLKRQDRKQLWPHITIQNRVTVFKAQLLFEQLRAGFEPFDITVTGFRTWMYFYGPWKPVAYYPFER
jgi:hypothetical protein